MTIRNTNQSRAVKSRGRAAENAVVEWLRSHGRPYVERRRLTGTHDCGDLTGIPGVVVEVKATKSIDLAGFVDELEDEMINADAETGVVIIKRRGTTDVGNWYAVMPASVWLQLLEEAGR